ncbi:general secretion pathway protein GspB [Lysobacter korlensis]|uniref:General secretion pathway protein GspB n=1 Tax=Lysobacter korlensis TaxID=553636 RepID=A0ABV6RKN8_9GAMM
MSLILEALRKSEAERRRGAPPQLLDPPVTAVPAAGPAEARRWPRGAPAALAFAVMVVAGVSGYRIFAGADEPMLAGNEQAAAPEADGFVSAPTQARTEPPVLAPAAPAASAETAREIAVAAEPEPAQSPPALPAAVAAPAAAPDQAVRPAADAPAAVADRRVAAVDAPAPRVAAEPMRRPDPESRPVAAAVPPAPAPQRPLPAARPPSEAVAAASARSAAPAPIATAPAPIAVTSSAASAPSRGTQRLADLAPADRSALPPLRMSMHLWSPSATERFVILDGQRMSEGDRIGGAVVDEITAEGAVLAWQGRRLLVPVR